VATAQSSFGAFRNSLSKNKIEESRGERFFEKTVGRMDIYIRRDREKNARSSLSSARAYYPPRPLASLARESPGLRATLLLSERAARHRARPRQRNLGYHRGITLRERNKKVLLPGYVTLTFTHERTTRALIEGTRNKHRSARCWEPEARRRPRARARVVIVE